MSVLEREGAMRVAVLLLAVVVLVIADNDKRAEMSPVPFVLGSRYGRSPGAPRLLAPRNDRFFMGSRYGKRSEVVESAGAPGDGAAGAAGGGRGGAVTSSVLCEPLGALFRCRPSPLWLADNRRLEDEPLSDEE